MGIGQHGGENEQRLLRGPFRARAGTVGKDASLNFSCDKATLAAHDPVSTEQILKRQDANRHSYRRSYTWKMWRVSCRIPKGNTGAAVLPVLEFIFCRVTSKSDIRESDIWQEDSISHPERFHECLWLYRVISQ